MASFPWQPVTYGIGLILTAIVVYYSSQVSLAEELGDRPTREEMNGHITELKETIVREVQEAKEQQATDYGRIEKQQAETREDIRTLSSDLRRLILDGRSR